MRRERENEAKVADVLGVLSNASQRKPNLFWIHGATLSRWLAA